MLNNLQLFILHNPSQTLTLDENSLPNQLFSKVISMRTNGYQTRHTGNYLPLDSTDFIADHIIVCEMRGNEPIPLMSYKSVTVQKCLQYNLKFPFLSILYDSGNIICLNETKKTIKQCFSENILVSYDAGWTMNPAINNNKNHRTILKDLTILTCSKFHRLNQIPYWFTFGICKVKTDLFFKMMGSEPISDSPLIKHSGLMGEDAVAFLHKNHHYPETLLNKVEIYNSLWKKRIEIRKDDEETIIKAA